MVKGVWGFIKPGRLKVRFCYFRESIFLFLQRFWISNWVIGFEIGGPQFAILIKDC